MNTASNARPVVMVGVDGTEDGVRALRYAVGEARRRDARLRVVHVEETGVMVVAPMAPLMPDPTLHEIAAEVIKDAEQQARDLGYDDPDLEGVLATGPRNRALVENAEGTACVVLGRHSSHLEHLMTGSTTAAVSAHAPVPVISVPSSWDPDRPSGPVVVGVEDVANAQPLLAAGFEAARCRRASLEIVHAWRPTSVYDAAIGSHAFADEWARSTRTAMTDWVHEHFPNEPVEWAVKPRYDRPVDALHEASASAELLVAGRHGHPSAFSFPLGATTRALLRTGACPVMVVPTARHG